MTSLSAHLREPGDHGRLAFHPECPICRDERLAGALPADAIVGRRAQALFATGVLAFASTPLSAALAAAPDQEREGTSAPEQIAAVDPAADADFDPGGESTDLPFDAGSPPAPQAAPAPDEDDRGARAGAGDRRARTRGGRRRPGKHSGAQPGSHRRRWPSASRHRPRPRRPRRQLRRRRQPHRRASPFPRRSLPTRTYAPPAARTERRSARSLPTVRARPVRTAPAPATRTRHRRART